MEFLLDISKVAASGIQSVVSKIVHIRDDHVVSVYIYINVDSFSYAQLCIYIRIAHKMNMCIRYPHPHIIADHMRNMRISLHS